MLADPRFIERANRKTLVIHTFDVPYLCGYSRDGRTVYVDRHLRSVMDGHDLLPFLLVHEKTEKALIDIFGLDYEEAHWIALHCEQKAVRAAGIDWHHYCRFLDPQIKSDADEQIVRAPPDLDLTPYKDEKSAKALYAKLLTFQKGGITEERFLKRFLAVEAVSLEYHDELNPAIWENGDKLKSDIRTKLLTLADVWSKFARIDNDMIRDIIITGGNVNFNYTPFSDIDLHIVVDKQALAGKLYGYTPPKDPVTHPVGAPASAVMDDYLRGKKKIWGLTHDVRIGAYPVELYAQGTDEGYHDNQGVYSLKDNKWIQEPTHGAFDFANDKALGKKVEIWQKRIDDAVTDVAPLAQVEAMKERIAAMRKAGIAKGGEFAFENLIFKALRNSGHLQKLSDYIRKTFDHSLSL